MEERIEKLKNQVKELLEWKKSRLIQQIPFNPPVNTTKIMHLNHLILTGNVSTTVALFETWLEVKLDDKFYIIPSSLNA